MTATGAEDADHRCSADRLLGLALLVISIPNPDLAGTWPRAAAVLGRQALEAGLSHFWAEVEPGVETGSMRAQLLCLPTYTHPELAMRTRIAWHGLSAACHHQAYELPPTAAELNSWLNDVKAFMASRTGPREA